MSRGRGITEDFKPPRSRPKTPQHLERLISAYSSAEALAPGRVRHWISTMALLGALERVQHGGAPMFVVKGGVAMELRLHLRARATKDLDLLFLGEVGRGEKDHGRALEDALDAAFEHSYSNFTFRRKGRPAAIRDTGSYRVEVALDYSGRSWQTLQVEASPPEGRSEEPEFVASAISIQGFLLEAPESVAVLSLRHQIAQKLHAEARARHGWPPDVVVHVGWDELYERAARDLNFPVSDVQDAAERIRTFIAAIDAAR